MKIDYTSDLHLDFILGHEGQHNKGRIERLLKHKMGFNNTDADALIIGGDLGHYNRQNIEFLKYMAENHYKHVVFVHGNHDLYLLSKKQKETYKKNSFNRLLELKKEVDKLDNIHYLDGDIVELDGIKIAGSCLWYDYSYGLQRGVEFSDIQEYFSLKTNDANKITNPTNHMPVAYEDFEKPRKIIDNLVYAAEQKAKLLKVVKESDPDIIVSHIPPDHELCEGTKKTQSKPLFSGSMYSCNTQEFDSYIQGKTWIFGHIHEIVEVEKRGCRFLSAPYGYYAQERNNPFGRINVDR